MARPNAHFSVAQSRTLLLRSAALIVVVAALAGAVLAWWTIRDLPAPDAHGVTISGEPFSIKSMRGKVVLVHFWSTSCAPCLREMPKMVDTYKAFSAQGLELVAVAMQYDPPSYVLDFSQRRTLPFKVALDPDGMVAKSFGDVAFTPTTFVIDKQGHIIKRFVGETDLDELRRMIRSELAA